MHEQIFDETATDDELHEALWEFVQGNDNMLQVMKARDPRPSLHHQARLLTIFAERILVTEA